MEDIKRIIGQNEYLILDSALRQLEQFHPDRIILFGSYATCLYKPGVSDIDLCIIAESKDKRKTLTEMYSSIRLDIPCDFILYTPPEWAEAIKDPGSFANKISKTGLVLLKEFNSMAVPGPPLIIRGEDKLKSFLAIRPNPDATQESKRRVDSFKKICIKKE
ncbi:MAG: nucleotidyltransferase domain-containing protein [Parabacteroides sp.]|nr:nucleotidyltransferase domain-containing protein [Parabacteroides sp.]